MRVSIVIPTYNRAELLKDTLRSALAQNYADLEIIVSDNASTDHTSQAMAEFLSDSRVKYFKNKTNIGMVPNWHKAVFERATGDWFLLLSDDDILTNSQFISRAVELINSDKDIKVVYSNAYVYDEAFNRVSNLDLPFKSIEDGLKVFASRGTIKPQDFALCGVLFPRQLAQQLNAFANPHNLSCDTELFLRLCLRGKVGVIHQYSSVYRMHSGNLLKSVSKNENLLMGSLDSLLVPLAEAKALQISNSVIEKFCKNAPLRRELIVCLVKLGAKKIESANGFYNKITSNFSQVWSLLRISSQMSKLAIFFGRGIVPFFAFRRRVYYLFDKLTYSCFNEKKPFLNLFLGTKISRNIDGKPVVGIALATYNPHFDFLLAQINSIKSQSYSNWKCVIVDDCSEKSAFDKICELVGADPRFECHRNEVNQGSFKTFERALSLLPSEAEFICFCDQDDIWVPTKIESQLEILLDSTISLVHTDQSLIDGQGKIFASSCWSMEGRNIPEATTDLLLFRNLITGCTTMFRKNILESALPFPSLRPKPQMYHHDMWIAMHACLHGRVVGLKESLVQYRQHGGNLVGVASLQKSYMKAELLSRAHNAFAERLGLLDDFLVSLDRGKDKNFKNQQEQLYFIKSPLALFKRGFQFITPHPYFFRVWVMLFVGQFMGFIKAKKLAKERGG
jgi:glycosyltransferase involved in cell wall biosynthesis